MRRHPLRSLISVAAIALTLGAAVTPAQAASTPVSMTFTAGPDPVLQNAALSLSGRVWVRATGNAAKVQLYFQRTGAQTWVAGGYVVANDKGYFAKKTTARTSGTWRAVYQGTGTRPRAARTDASRVVKAVPRRIATYSSSEHIWGGPTVRIPTKEYHAVVTYSCADGSNPDDVGILFGIGPNSFLDHPYDQIFSDKPAGTITMYGHRGQQVDGYFQAYTLVDCTWSAQVYAGTTNVAV